MNSKHQRLLVSFAAAAMLASCGGGGGGDVPATSATPPPAPAPTTDVPASASASSAGALAFVSQVVVSSGSDTADPLLIGDATLATSETDEPAAI